ncbi:MAG: redoxin domain-containing protein [Candidatus Omnitrophica bacterium]|nr:redoxin domain-containing protein [Candidatus Omnitrophota bacterium]
MRILTSLMMFLSVAVLPAFADSLTWQDLLRRPELKPSQCSVKEVIQFQSGVSLKPGQKYDILEMSANEIVLGTPNGQGFSLEPKQTDVVAAANAEYAKLTPKQRELTYDIILKRQDLWPYKLKVKDTFDIGNIRIRKGDTVYLMEVKNGELVVVPSTFNMHTEFKLQDTDILEQARQFVEQPGGAPGILVEELQGKLINPATGQPASLDANNIPQYFVIYQGARWCPYCQEFTPKLLDVYQKMKSQNKSFEVIYIPSDKSAAEMQQFAKDHNFPWPAVDFRHKEKLAALAGILNRSSIPNVKVTDRYGNIILDNQKTASNDVLLNEFVALLNKPAEQK